MRQQLSDAQRQTENLHLGFLIFPGFPMACLTSMIEPLRAANEISGREAFRWSLITEDGAPVESSAKVAFHPSTDLTALRGMDHVIVLSPPNGGFANPRAGNAAPARQGVAARSDRPGLFPRPQTPRGAKNA